MFASELLSMTTRLTNLRTTPEPMGRPIFKSRVARMVGALTTSIRHDLIPAKFVFVYVRRHVELLSSLIYTSWSPDASTDLNSSPRTYSFAVAELQPVKSPSRGTPSPVAATRCARRSYLASRSSRAFHRA